MWILDAIYRLWIIVRVAIRVRVRMRNRVRISVSDLRWIAASAHSFGSDFFSMSRHVIKILQLHHRDRFPNLSSESESC